MSFRWCLLESRRLTSRPRRDAVAFWLCLAGLALAVAAALVATAAPAPGKSPLTRRTAILLDVSGSMRGHRIAAARSGLRDVLEQQTDQWDVRLYVFAGTLAREGGWHRLPDGEAVALLVAWAAAFEPDGDTRLWVPLDDVLAENADVVDLSALVVTDGGTARDDPAMDAVLGRGVAVHVLAVEPAPSDRARLRALASGTGGEYAEVRP